MKKISCFLFILFLFNSLAYSQNHDAELFFKDGTSLTGFAMLYKNDQIKFRLTLEDKADIWTDLMVEKITFYFSEFNVTFKYIKITANKPPKLLKIVTDGSVILFARVITKPKYIGGNFSNNWETTHNITKYYVQRNNEKFPTLISRNFKKIAKNYFSNCIGLSEKLDTGEFRYFTIGEMVDYYNNYCAD